MTPLQRLLLSMVSALEIQRLLQGLCGLILYDRFHSVALWLMYDSVNMINPRRMHEDYRSCSVHLSVTKLAAVYLICESKVW